MRQQTRKDHLNKKKETKESIKETKLKNQSTKVNHCQNANLKNISKKQGIITCLAVTYKVY